MSTENLEKIAAHTENRNEKRFDMGNFCIDVDDLFNYWPENSINVCNTVACILGDCPKIKGLKPKVTENWREYSERITGLTRRSNAWNYLFSAKWKYTDNTAEGAAKRIYYYLKHGVPSDWLDQMYGTSPLSYK